VAVGTRGVVVGKVVDVRRHPNGEKIWLADVDLGDGSSAQIVFGGRPVVRPSSLVPVAPPGSRLPEGTKIRRRRYRGEISEGMLCSLAELGWDLSVTDRVALLDGSLLPGMSLDNRANDWSSIVANPRTDRAASLLRTIREASGSFRPRHRGLERKRLWPSHISGR
jgi:phenylalanyl-tRNA synthetase beta chain